MLVFAIHTKTPTKFEEQQNTLRSRYLGHIMILRLSPPQDQSWTLTMLFLSLTLRRYNCLSTLSLMKYPGGFFTFWGSFCTYFEYPLDLLVVVPCSILSSFFVHQSVSAHFVSAVSQHLRSIMSVSTAAINEGLSLRLEQLCVSYIAYGLRSDHLPSGSSQIAASGEIFWSLAGISVSNSHFLFNF